jgi:hypothetical protein
MSFSSAEISRLGIKVENPKTSQKIVLLGQTLPRMPELERKGQLYLEGKKG